MINNQVPNFTSSDTKCYVPIVTLYFGDNAKLLQQLISGFKISISWNKYLSKITIQEQIRSKNYLIDPSFHRKSRVFVLSL